MRRLFIAAVIGIIAANAGFAAGFLGPILVGPWTGWTYPAIIVGIATACIAMLVAFVFTLRTLGRLKYAVFISH